MELLGARVRYKVLVDDAEAAEVRSTATDAKLGRQKSFAERAHERVSCIPRDAFRFVERPAKVVERHAKGILSLLPILDMGSDVSMLVQFLMLY